MSEQSGETTPRPVVAFKRGKDGKWYFNIKAANGEIVAQSEGYERLRGAQHGYEALRDLVLSAVLTNPTKFTVEDNDQSQG